MAGKVAPCREPCARKACLLSFLSQGYDLRDCTAEARQLWLSSHVADYADEHAYDIEEEEDAIDVEVSIQAAAMFG